MLEKNLVRVVNAGKMRIAVYENRKDMGCAAAAEAGDILLRLLKEQDEVSVLFACAVSQLDFFPQLFKRADIEWERVVGFVMDEYMGLTEGSPYLLSNFAKEHISSQANFKAFFTANGANPDYEGECERYAKLMAEHPLDLVCLGIGENGHLAYNDPHVADFNDPKTVKLVEIDETSRRQAIHDGAFPAIETVPYKALTVTIPAMTNAPNKIVVVPGPHKSKAIQATAQGPIALSCPASILRNYDCVLYTDVDGASLI